jgi:hypothetical protein
LKALRVNHRVVAIYRVVYFRRPRVYRDEKRVFHDILNYQWNSSNLRWSIRFSDFHIDGFQDNSRNFFDGDISASDSCFAQLWVWIETQSIRYHRVKMITIVDIIPDLRSERPRI